MVGETRRRESGHRQKDPVSGDQRNLETKLKIKFKNYAWNLKVALDTTIVLKEKSHLLPSRDLQSLAVSLILPLVVKSSSKKNSTKTNCYKRPKDCAH